MTDPAIIEAAARAIGQTDEDNNWEEIPFDDRDWYRELAMCVLVKVTPLIEARTLERAAKVADGWLANFSERDPEFVTAQRWANNAVSDIADAIRALKEQL